MKHKKYPHPQIVPDIASSIEEGLSAMKIQVKYFSSPFAKMEVGYQYVKKLVNGYKRFGDSALLAPGIGARTKECLYYAGPKYRYSGTWPEGNWLDPFNNVMTYKDIIKTYEDKKFLRTDLMGTVVPSLEEALKTEARLSKIKYMQEQELSQGIPTMKDLNREVTS